MWPLPLYKHQGPSTTKTIESLPRGTNLSRVFPAGEQGEDFVAQAQQLGTLRRQRGSRVTYGAMYLCSSR